MRTAQISLQLFITHTNNVSLHKYAEIIYEWLG